MNIRLFLVSDRIKGGEIFTICPYFDGGTDFPEIIATVSMIKATTQ
jgi:hypothetical protein